MGITMKKRNIGILVCAVTVCCIALLVIFRGYYTWSERTFDKLLYENQKAYARSQKAEVVSNVEDVRTSLKTISAVLETCNSEEEIYKFSSVLKSMGERGYVQTEGVEYFSFAMIDTIGMREEDQYFIEQLRNGESVISSVNISDIDKQTYFGIAEPVKINGEYVGFIRGLITSDTLLYSSQTGILRNETESYLIHENGMNAFMDYMEKDKIINLYDVIKSICDEPEQIEIFEKNIQSSDQLEVLQTTAGGKAVFISYSELPYNDWAILNITYSEEVDAHIKRMASGARNTAIFVVGTSVIVMLLLCLTYYWTNKDQYFEKKRAVLIANFSDTVLCEYNLKKDQLNCTSNITRMFPIEDIIVEDFSCYMTEHQLIHPDDLALMNTILREIPEDNEVREYEIRLKDLEGNYKWYEIHIVALYVKGKKPDRIILKITDIAEKKREVLGLMEKAQIDSLTGLLNKSTFANSVEELLQKRKGGYLFLIDLDNFKQINDRYGHQKGDELLMKTAECMKRCFRSEDYLGRYGGDEFLVFMSATAEKNVVEARADQLIESISHLIKGMNMELNLTCSVGIAEDKGEGYKELVRKADAAMYRAKKAGKNSWVLE